MIQTKDLRGIVLLPVFVLLVPLVAMQFTDEVVWGPLDFLVAWVLMAVAGLAYKLATSQTGNVAYRIAAGMAVATAFLLVWANLAVGLIGNEGNPANLMYGGVLAVGIVGAGLARLQSRGMVRALWATALAQFLVPVVALIVSPPDVTPLVWAGNALFVILFVGSALLFRRAANQPDSPRVETPA
ncbi:MAG: hypothetical protein Q8J74_04435 [Candidatus Didemnitutus sp.]|nr:hypothetical protein [Candidatus Didemnitutus sp.]